MDPADGSSGTDLRQRRLVDRLAVPFAFVWTAGVIALDLAIGGSVNLAGLMAVPALVASFQPVRRATVTIDLMAVVVASLLGVAQHNFFSADHFVTTFLVLMVAAMSLFASDLQRQLQGAAARAIEQARTDQLTGTTSRVALFERGHELAGRRHLGRGAALSVVMVDLDDFKEINDRFGHQAGDQVLAEAAARITGAVRAGDVVGRYGGDEFMVLVVGHSREEAERVAQRICGVVADTPYHLGDYDVHVSASVGLAVMSVQDRSLDAVITRADRALYHSKQHGRARVSVA